MSLVTRCSHCAATLRLKDDSYLGKKVRCPKCQEAFTVRPSSKSRTSSKSKRASASRTEKSPLFLDDVEDDLIEDWEDDHWDDFEETDSRPPRSRKRPSNKKRRKKKTLDLDDQYERIRRNIRAIGVIYFFFGGLILIGSLAMLGDPDEKASSLIILAIGLSAFFSGGSLLTHRPWGIPCCKVVSAIYMLAIPIGTFLGAYFLMNVGYVEDEFS